jgi:hypothetical protein
MHNIAAGTVQDAAQVIERAGDIDVGNIDMPMFVGFDGLLKTGAFSRRPPVPAL